MMTKNKKKESPASNRYGFLNFYIPFVMILTLLDQLTKLAAYCALKGNPGIQVIPHILQFQYLENRGAAFGMMRNKQWMFIVFAVFVILSISFVFKRLPVHKKYLALRIVSCVLSAGALGNMIDRILHTYVIDFVYFSVIDFPIFNVADIYVVTGCIVFLYLIIFRYNEEDFEFLNKKK